MPKGEGPFPAVILLHGCTGVPPAAREWLLEYGIHLGRRFPYSRRLQQAFGSSPRIGAAPLLGCSSYPEGRRRLIKGVGPDQGPAYNRMTAREGRFQ